MPVTPLFNVKVAELTVDAAIGSLNVAVIAAFTATAVALFAGLVDDTVGQWYRQWKNLLPLRPHSHKR